MFFYLSLILFLMIILFLSSYSKRYSNLLLFIFFTIIFLVVGLRGDIGQDTYAYGVHYDNLINFKSLLYMLSNKEPFLYIIMYVYKSIFNGYTGFLVLVSFLQVVLLSYATRNLYHKLLFFFFYLTIFLFDYHLSGIRITFSMLFYLCSLSVVDKSKKKAVFFLLLAVSSHVTILVLVPVLISRVRLSLKKILFLTIIFSIIGLMFYTLFIDFFLHKIESYDLFKFSDFRFPLLVSLILVLVWFLIFSSKNLTPGLVSSLFIFSLFFYYSSFSSIAHRFYMIALLSTMFFMFEKKSISFSTLKVRPHFIAILIVSCWFSYNTLYLVSIEKENISKTGKGNAEFSYTPYKFYFESTHR